jgi:tripartite-type tricarboxylate transporter receptor subunit TctC
LNGAVHVAMRAPGMATRLAALGAEPAAGTPEALTELIRRDTEKWSRVIRISGARVD